MTRLYKQASQYKFLLLFTLALFSSTFENILINSADIQKTTRSGSFYFNRWVKIRVLQFTKTKFK